jgi:hypothetical protein
MTHTVKVITVGLKIIPTVLLLLPEMVLTVVLFLTETVLTALTFLTDI